MDLIHLAAYMPFIGLVLLGVAVAVTVWVIERHAMDDPDARAERYRDRFNERSAARMDAILAPRSEAATG
jgi:hypothetical protein